MIDELGTNIVWSSRRAGVEPKRGRGQLHDLSLPGERRLVDWAPGACLIMHRSTWQLHGAFDRVAPIFSSKILNGVGRVTAAGGTVEISDPIFA